MFDRKVEIDALGALISAIKADAPESNLSEAAIALDATAVLRIPGHQKSSDIVDYLGAHNGPLIMPGQVIQEFWNNQLSVIDTVSKGLQKSFDAMNKEIVKAEMIDDRSVQPISDAMQIFREKNEVLFHPETIRRTVVFMEALVGRAVVPFAPRAPLAQAADHRKRAKTPPGFRDQGDGDFLVWSDLLFGSLRLQRRGVSFKRLLFVTNDAKIDWCREGKAHPILVAEVKALLGVDFEIWTLDKLARAIS